MSAQVQKRRPRDLNQLAAAIVAVATAEEEPEPEPSTFDQPEATKKNPAAVALGRLGGRKGGPARAAKLSPERRREIAQKAAAIRWANREKPAG